MTTIDADVFYRPIARTIVVGHNQETATGDDYC